jgi:hypothetical protein
MGAVLQSMIIVASGEGAHTPGLENELREALSAEAIRPAPLMGGMAADVWRYAVEWGPHILVVAGATKPALEVMKLAVEIVDKLLALKGRHFGLTLTIPSRNGPIKVENATREEAEKLIAAELARAANAMKPA